MLYGLTPFERSTYDLFNVFHEFEKDFFNTKPSHDLRSCKTDICDKGDKFVLEAELPGFSKDDINIDIKGDYLTLTASHKTEKEDKDDNGNYICRERTFGSYQRRYDISNVDADAIEAEYKDGILTLDLPKKAKTEPESRRLEIK